MSDNKQTRGPVWKRWIKILLIYIPLSCLLTSLAFVVLLKYVPVKHTPLMAIRSWGHRNQPDFQTRKSWKTIDEMGSNIVMAAMAAEDIRFQIHSGFDWAAIQAARENNKGKGALRGGSTISQQTAKNVFLWPERSWLRKALEAYFTVCIEWIWGKQRIIEVYLNVVETGPGLYGVESAAQYFFNKSTHALTEEEAALLVSCFPNPKERDPRQPSLESITRQQFVYNIMQRLPVPKWLH